ncbi:MAG: TadE/TadG family type IV pilus assembly protein [Pseudomonadota bacterium]
MGRSRRRRLTRWFSAWHRGAPGRRARGFARNERGSATIEFVLWIPFFLILLGILTDSATLYLRQNEMWNVSRDTARLLATGQITEAQATGYARDNLPLAGTLNYTITANDPSDLSKWVDIKVKIGEASVFGFFAAIANNDLTARAVMRAEPL